MHAVAALTRLHLPLDRRSVAFVSPPAIAFSLKPMGNNALNVDVTHLPGLSTFLHTFIRDRLSATITEPRPLVLNLRAAFGRQPKAQVAVAVRRVVGVSAEVRHDCFVRVSVNGAFEETPAAALQCPKAGAAKAGEALAPPCAADPQQGEGGEAHPHAARPEADAPAPSAPVPGDHPLGAAADPSAHSSAAQTTWEASWDPDPPGGALLPHFTITNWAKFSRVKFEVFFWRSLAPHALAGTHILDLKSALQNYSIPLTGARRALWLPLGGAACPAAAGGGAFLLVEIGVKDVSKLTALELEAEQLKEEMEGVRRRRPWVPRVH